jgi:hypothetical protein
MALTYRFAVVKPLSGYAEAAMLYPQPSRGLMALVMSVLVLSLSPM